MVQTSALQLNNKQHDALLEYYKQVLQVQSMIRSNFRGVCLNIDKIYQREGDLTTEQRRAKVANRSGDPNKFQNIVVPVVKPHVETATAYQSSVFLTGVPMFGVVSHADFIDEALQLETIIDNHATYGGWTREFLMSFRDGFKYNFAPMEITWDRQVSWTVETDIAFSPTEAKPKETIWSGNKLRRLDPYNTIVDPSVHPTEVYSKGEFAGYTEMMGRIALKKFIAELPDKQTRVTAAFEAGEGVASVSDDPESANYYRPTINVDQDLIRLTPDGINWMRWASLNEADNNIQYKDHYEVTTLYCRILPQEFAIKVPNRATPQVWKLIIINHATIIYAERQTNAHNWLPVLIGQPMEDGLGYQTKSVATDAEPFQQVASAFMNSIVHGRRRAVTDRLLYDPSRVAQAQINSPNPSAKIPVRPAAYGKDISDAVHQFSYREDQAVMGIQQISELLKLSDHLQGQNAARQGQFIKGNKTREEFATTVESSESRDQMSAILYEAQVFIPFKHILKINVLQYQGTEVLHSREKQQAVSIDPAALRKATLEFKISDGLVPSSKIVSSENLAVALQTMGSSPAISTGYNITPLFSYLMKTKGADLRAFEKTQEQIAYEQAMSQWQQIVSLMIEKADTVLDAKAFPPQPLPEQFGYNPNPQAQTPKGQQAEI